MTETTLSAEEQASLRARLWVWTLCAFAPPLAAAALHWWLGTKAEVLPPAFPLEDVTVLGSNADLAWTVLPPLLAVVVILALLFWLRRRLGWKGLGKLLIVPWWLLCAGWAWSTWAKHADRAQLEPVPEVRAEARRVFDIEASTHGPGGALVIMQSPAWPGPRRVLLEDAPSGSVTLGSTLALRMARGARGGSYVTAWSVAASAPAAASASAPAPAGR